MYILAVMSDSKHRRIASGLVFIVVGLALWALQWAEGVGRAVFFCLVGGAFLAGYLYRRKYGFLIPGCLLLGLGAGQLGRDSVFSFGDPTHLGLGSGFVAIFVIAFLYERRSHWWPLIPGGILILVGLPNTERALQFLYRNWPLILVFIGLMILLGAFGRPKGRRERGAGG